MEVTNKGEGQRVWRDKQSPLSLEKKSSVTSRSCEKHERGKASVLETFFSMGQREERFSSNFTASRGKRKEEKRDMKREDEKITHLTDFHGRTDCNEKKG